MKDSKTEKAIDEIKDKEELLAMHKSAKEALALKKYTKEQTIHMQEVKRKVERRIREIEKQEREKEKQEKHYRQSIK